MKIIIYKENDIIKKISPAKNIDISLLLHLIPKNCEYKMVESNDIPDLSDVTINHDSALMWDLTHNLDKLKERKKEQIRQIRKDLFSKNDITLRDATIENDPDKLSIGIKERDRLRDLPQKVDACKTIEEIKSIEV